MMLFFIPKPVGTYYKLKLLHIERVLLFFLLLFFPLQLSLFLCFNILSHVVFSLAQYLVFDVILHIIYTTEFFIIIGKISLFFIFEDDPPIADIYCWVFGGVIKTENKPT